MKTNTNAGDVVGLNDAQKRRSIELARDIDQTRRIIEQSAPWGSHEYSGQVNGEPTLHLDDVSGIPFLQDILGVELYQLRARVRAMDGDLFAATCPAMPEYEAYNTHRLGLGAPTFLHAPTDGRPIEVSNACTQGRAFDDVVAYAAQKGGMNIHPYMGIEAVWDMASKVSQSAHVPVRVVAPPPPITWYANDKCDLTELLNALFDTPLAVASRIATSSSELAEQLLALSHHHPRVALKMGRCASAMGNRIYEASQLQALSTEAREALVTDFLNDKEWSTGEPVLAVAWEDAESSPSSQLWIPPLGQGDPTMDGVYEQLLQGPEKVFLGSIPSRLGPEMDRHIGEVSLAVAHVYQQLGYVGRCSFDFIVTPGGLRFTECNGRWGGTSTPMHLMDRLFPSGRPAYRARDYVEKRLVNRGFDALESAIGDALYDAKTQTGSFILYNVGCLVDYGKFDVIAIGDTVEQASNALEDQFPQLLESL